jgi:hypothetical protein
MRSVLLVLVAVASATSLAAVATASSSPSPSTTVPNVLILDFSGWGGGVWYVHTLVLGEETNGVQGFQPVVPHNGVADALVLP